MKTYSNKGYSAAGSGTSVKSYAPAPRCFESHPFLEIGGGTLVGGNCNDPMVTNADVYVGLDYSMKEHQAWPWQKKKSSVIDVHYKITDYCAPKDEKSFKDMIEWLCNQLQEGKIVHVGCIGGHGRTGTVISAIVATMEARGVMNLGKLSGNAVEWVRRNYCTKAVESDAQSDFLNKYFGCKKVKGAKPPPQSTGKYSYTGKGGYDYYGSQAGTGSNVIPLGVTVSSVRGNRFMWEKVKK